MGKYAITLIDRQTKKTTVVWIEATNRQEAKQIAMRDYGIAYEIK